MSQQEIENRNVLIEGGLTRFYIEWGMSGKRRPKIVEKSGSRLVTYEQSTFLSDQASISIHST